MHLRILAVALALGFVAGCNCAGPGDPCAGVKCGPGLECDPDLVRCVAPGTGGGTGGASGDAGGGQGGGGGGGTSACSPACTGSTPICDAAGRCVTCTSTTGCSGVTPICFTDANGGLGRCMTCLAGQGCTTTAPFCDVTVPPAGSCYQCQQHTDCQGGLVCEPLTRSCVVDDGGFGGGSGGGGGTGGGGGSTSVVVVWGDGGAVSRCLSIDAGLRPCTNNECPTGFECVGGACVLRGKNGELQVTLRWQQPEDVDLYVVEPLPDAGKCEIFYGQPNRDASVPFPFPIPIPLPPGCGAKGWLDLDSNANCNIDNVDVENIIYPPQVSPTRGPYTVRANYYQSCQSPPSVPYEVEVRVFGQTRFYCGAFTPSQANGGSQGAGTVVSQFELR